MTLSLFEPSALFTPTLAGMPSVGLSEIGALRLQSLSFFLLGFFLSAWGVKWLWNSLQKDFPRWPRLTYPKAWGLALLANGTIRSFAADQLPQLLTEEVQP